MCDLQPFIIDAAKWKAKTVLKQTEMNSKYFSVNW
jgi:CTP:phosphocholine cytidylyltransferase-like protein